MHRDNSSPMFKINRHIARTAIHSTTFQTRISASITQLSRFYATRTMKRKAADSPEPVARKAAKVGDYCYVPVARDVNGNPVWPAPDSQMSAARAFLREWCVISWSHEYLLMFDSAAAQAPTLIVPDKDADGLSSGVIIHRTLVKLGLKPEHLQVHLVQKGSNIHEEFERRSMLEKKPKFVIVLDQGSRGGPPVIDDPDTRCLIIDHHLSDDFPKDAEVKTKH